MTWAKSWHTPLRLAKAAAGEVVTPVALLS